MTDDLEHLTAEERKAVLEIYPKGIKDLESTDDGKSKSVPPAKENASEPEVDRVKEDWKDGYLDYEKKTKDSDRVIFEEGDIEVVEEDL